MGTQMDKEGIAKVLDMAAEDVSVKPVIEEKTGLEITCRRKDGYRYYFVMNFEKRRFGDSLLLCRKYRSADRGICKKRRNPF